MGSLDLWAKGHTIRELESSLNGSLGNVSGAELTPVTQEGGVFAAKLTFVSSPFLKWPPMFQIDLII